MPETGCLFYSFTNSNCVEAKKKYVSRSTCDMKTESTADRQAFEMALLYKSFEQDAYESVFQKARDSYLKAYGANARLMAHEVVKRESSKDICGKGCSLYALAYTPKDKRWEKCAAFQLASNFLITPFLQKTICYLAGGFAPEKCKNCRKHASKEPRQIYVKDLRFWGHPATVILQYYPVEECKEYQKVINEKLSGVHPYSGKNVKRFSNRLVKAINRFLILDDPEINAKRLRFISEACDMSRNTLKHWRDREQRAAKMAYDQKLAEQHLRMDSIANAKMCDENCTTHFLYVIRPGSGGAALSDMHAAEDWKNLEEAFSCHHPRAVNRIDMKPPGFFNLAYDFLLFEYPQIPTALGALLLTYLRFHYRPEDVLWKIGERLDHYTWEYYYNAIVMLTTTYWKYHVKDKSKDSIIEFLKLSSRKLVPCHKEYERGTSTEAIRSSWNKCRRLAKEYEIAFHAKPRVVRTGELERAHAELCTQVTRSTLPESEIAERLLAFNPYALSDVEHCGKMDYKAGIRFTEQGDFIYTFSHLKVDGGMPLDELLPMVQRGLLYNEEEKPDDSSAAIDRV